MISSSFLLKHFRFLIYRDGHCLVPLSDQPGWPQLQFLRRLLRRLQIDCVLDVGANVGQYGLELRRIGYRGQIVSFEPDPASFAALQAAAAGNGPWRVLNCALGAEPGEMPFNRMANPVFNSFRAPTDSETRLHVGENRVLEQVVVEIGTLNEILPALMDELGVSRPFLKMDTQGFDLEVLKGADQVLDRLPAFQSEISVKRLYEGSPSWRQSIEAYERMGFTLAGLYPVNAGLEELLEFDCYMVRTQP